LCELAAGGISKEITPNKAQRLLDTLTPATPVERTRHQLACDHVADLRHLDTQLRASRRRVEEAVAASGTSLTVIFGIGPIVAAMIIGHTRDVGRFATRDRYAAYDADWRYVFVPGLHDHRRDRTFRWRDRKLSTARLPSVRVRPFVPDRFHHLGDHNEHRQDQLLSTYRTAMQHSKPTRR
jgi:hypothetical protein